MLLFHLRKLVASLLYPPTLSLLLAMVGLVLLLHGRWVKTGKGLVALGLFSLLLLSIPALQQPFLNSFEPDPSRNFPENPAAIVVLGAGVHEREPHLPATVRLGSTSLARAIEGIRLARTYPKALLIFTGGRITNGPASSQAMADLARDFGIPDTRIVAFTSPASTAEEAQRTAEDLEPNADILLVTSALHLPRAAALFEREGLKVTPAPSDYRSDSSPPSFLDFLPSSGTWENWQRLFHELYGRTWARLRAASAG